MRSLSMYVSKCSRERRQELGRRKLPESGGVQIVMEQKQDPSSGSMQTCCPQEIPNGSWACEGAFLQEGQAVEHCYVLRLEVPPCGQVTPYPSHASPFGYRAGERPLAGILQQEGWLHAELIITQGCRWGSAPAAVQGCSRSWRAAAGTTG